jgi:hypothetical protein
MKSIYFLNKQVTARFVAAVTVVSLLMSALPASFFVASAQTMDPAGTLNTSSQPYGKNDNVRICHKDNGNDNQTVNVNSIVRSQGHSGHDTDVIPPFWYQIKSETPVFYAGNNWDEEGIELYENGCESEEETPTHSCPQGTTGAFPFCFPVFEDKCPDVPGTQVTNLLCLPPPAPCPEGTFGVPPLCLPVFEDKCPDVHGHQLTTLLCPAPETPEKVVEEINVTGNTSAGENQKGWMFNRDTNTDTPIEFNSDQALLDAGSLEVFPIGANAADKFIGEYFWNGKIADLESFVYNFKIGAGGVDADANEFYLNVYANFGESADNKFYDCRYNIVPATGSTASFTAVTFDPTQSYTVTTRTDNGSTAENEASPYTCPAKPADMEALSASSTIRAFAINLGDTSVNDLGVDGYFDKVVLDTETKKTTFDFEPAPVPVCQYNPQIPANSDDCDPPATISLTKIVCEDETMLPNDRFTSIDANTATNFLAQHEGCALESGFGFQTALGGQPVVAENDNAGVLGSPWATTTPTNASGVTTVTIPAAQIGNGIISVREIWSDDYIPFTGQNGGPVSAEIYCANDAANYDNLEWIQGVTSGNTYHCVAWNVEVPEQPPVEECVNLLTNGSFETPTVTHVDLWDKFLGVTTGWLTERISDNTPTTLELHRDWSSNEAAHGAQYAELDGDHSTKISQTVALQNGATYELKWAFAPRHDAAVGENKLSVLINGNPVGANASDAGVANMTTANWTQGTHSFVAGGTSATITFADAGATSNSYGTFLDDARLCKTADPVPVATIVAEKVVCTTEAALPNWNTGGSAPKIDADTAQDWVDQSEGRCSLVPDWQFEWASENIADPSDAATGTAGIGWNTFGPTNGLGKTSVFLNAAAIDGDSFLWVREVLKDGYIPFTHQATPDNSNNVSAEMYCHTDGLNYDNWDRVDGIATGSTYHCVAFNAEMPKPVTQCTLEMYSDAGTVVVERNGYATSTYAGHDAWTASIPGATWIWNTFKADEINEPNSQTFTFEESFFVQNPTFADLDIAADNDYELSVNGVVKIPFSNESNYGSLTKDDINLLPYITSGTTTITVKVKNFGLDNSNYLQNPAGLLYKLVVKGDDTASCKVTTKPKIDHCPTLEGVQAQGVQCPVPPPVCLEGQILVGDMCVPVETDPETFILDGYKMEPTEAEGDDYTPVAGWIIYAINLDDDAEPLATTTDANGKYKFVVGEGNWKVYEDIPEDWEQIKVEQEGLPVNLEGEGPDFCTFNLPEEDDSDDEFDYLKRTEVDSSRCNFYNEFVGEVITPETPDDNDNNRRGGGGGTKVKKTPPAGEVLGVTTQCGMYLSDYMREGIGNDTWEVKKLQLFLNIVQGNKLEVNGIFDDATDEAVRAFQLKYQLEVLTPWFTAGFVPHNNPTGWVYQLTRWKINNIVCPGSEAAPTLLP